MFYLEKFEGIGFPTTLKKCLPVQLDVLEGREMKNRRSKETVWVIRPGG